MAGPVPGGPPGGGPEELLAQIRALLEQYLAMGADTPVAAEAGALAQAIDATAGAAPPPGGDMGMPPPGGDLGGLGGMPPPPDQGVGPQVPPNAQMGAGDLSMTEPPPNPGAKSFKSANVSALDRLQKRNKKQGSKA